jgi:hypothetical protein
VKSSLYLSLCDYVNLVPVVPLSSSPCLSIRFALPRFDGLIAWSFALEAEKMSTHTANSSSFSDAEDHVEAHWSSLVPTRRNEGLRGTVHEHPEPRRVVWTAEKSVHPSKLDAELDEFGPLSKCETKCDKTYYRCPFKKRFNCGMVIRTIREVVTGHIIIETRGLGHSHNDSEEQFQRGLSNAVKEAVGEITKFNDRIRPQALQRALTTVPFNFSMSDVKIGKITSYLHRIRQTKTSSYVEHTVSGLWNAVSSRQFDENSSDWANYYFTVTLLLHCYPRPGICGCWNERRSRADFCDNQITLG